MATATTPHERIAPDPTVLVEHGCPGGGYKLIVLPLIMRIVEWTV